MLRAHFPPTSLPHPVLRDGRVPFPPHIHTQFCPNLSSPPIRTSPPSHRPTTPHTNHPPGLTTSHCSQGIQIDYQKVADRMGLTNPRSVSNAWTAIKKKIAEFDKNDRKSRGLPSEDEPEPDNGDDDDTNPTPKKRARTAKAAAGGTTPRPRGKTATAGGSAKKAGRGGKKAAGGVPADATDAAAAAEDGGEQEEDAVKEEAGMIKLEREVVDEDGVESYVSGEI